MNAMKTQPYSPRSPSSRATIGMIVETARASKATSVMVQGCHRRFRRCLGASSEAGCDNQRGTTAACHDQRDLGLVTARAAARQRT